MSVLLRIFVLVSQYAKNQQSPTVKKRGRQKTLLHLLHPIFTGATSEGGGGKGGSQPQWTAPAASFGTPILGRALFVRHDVFSGSCNSTETGRQDWGSIYIYYAKNWGEDDVILRSLLA